MKKVLIAFTLFLLPFLFPSSTQAKYLDLVGTDPTETFKQGLDAEGMNYPQFGTYALQNTLQGFTKFLVGKDGQVIKRYAPNTEPKDIAADIEKALGN